MRNPATPRSNQKRRIRSNSRRDLGVPPVQVGLLRREVVEVVAAALLVERPGGAAAEDRLPVVRDLVGPDVEVGPFPKPRMPIRGVVRDEVEQDADPAGAGFRDEPIEIVERAEVGMDSRVVGDVVAPVDVRRGVYGVEPDRVDAEPREVLEPLASRRPDRRSRRRSRPRTSAGRPGTGRRLSTRARSRRANHRREPRRRMRPCSRR